MLGGSPTHLAFGVCVFRWHLGTKPEFMPLGHGFDQYYGIPYSPDMGASAWNKRGKFPPLPLVHGNTAIEQPTDLNKLSTRYVAYADRFIRNSTAAGNPFLLYLAWNHVHDPDFASPPFCGKSARGLYGDAVEELDWAVGQVMATLAAVHATNNTIVFFTSGMAPTPFSFWVLFFHETLCMCGGQAVALCVTHRPRVANVECYCNWGAQIMARGRRIT